MRASVLDTGILNTGGLGPLLVSDQYTDRSSIF